MGVLRLVTSDEEKFFKREKIKIEEKGKQNKITNQTRKFKITSQDSFDINKGPLWSLGYIDGYQNNSARLYFALHSSIRALSTARSGVPGA